MTESNLPREQQHRPILFYDGECGFCSAAVQYVLRHERAPVLLFAPLQGTTAEEILPKGRLPADIADKSIVVSDNGDYTIRSRAVARVLHYMGGQWAWLGRLLLLIPAVLADMVYRLVAANRSRLPQAKSCQLLSPEIRTRFLP